MIPAGISADSSRSYRGVPAAAAAVALGPGVQAVVFQLLPGLDLLHQPLWVGDLSGRVPALHPSSWGEQIPHAAVILHCADVLTCQVGRQRPEPELSKKEKGENAKSRCIQREPEPGFWIVPGDTINDELLIALLQGNRQMWIRIMH